MVSAGAPGRRARTALSRAVKTVAASADRARPAPAGIVVLLYHRVAAGSGLAVDLPVDLFDAQMAWLAESGRAITLDDALLALDGPAPDAGPRRPACPVVVTFDDGTADLVEHALPVLERHRVPSCWYVATDFVDSARPFPADGTPLSWGGLRDASATGLVTIGSHTHTHALLDRAPLDTVRAELDRSIDLIAEHVGAAPRHFAYPKALPPPRAVDDEVRSRFASAALAGTRVNAYGRTDPYRLARSPIQVADGMRWFARKAEGGLALEDTVRRVANRARYAGATT
jgi:peptidoglycan/xylan/chitin deacetylase (PgdA/CDA1 family)